MKQKRILQGALPWLGMVKEKTAEPPDAGPKLACLALSLINVTPSVNV